MKSEIINNIPPPQTDAFAGGPYPFLVTRKDLDDSRNYVVLAIQDATSGYFKGILITRCPLDPAFKIGYSSDAFNKTVFKRFDGEVKLSN